MNITSLVGGVLHSFEYEEVFQQWVLEFLKTRVNV